MSIPLVRCLVLDVDGVMTDGRLIYGPDGDILRAFHVQDGYAIRWFQKLRGEVVLCSGKRSPAVQHRANDLGIRYVLQGSRDKVADVESVLGKLGLDWHEVSAMGDDLPDLDLLGRCAYPIAPANAVPRIKSAVRYVTARAGGEGAVRDAIEHLMSVDGAWERVAGAP